MTLKRKVYAWKAAENALQRRYGWITWILLHPVYLCMCLHGASSSSSWCRLMLYRLLSYDLFLCWLHPHWHATYPSQINKGWPARVSAPMHVLKEHYQKLLCLLHRILSHLYLDRVLLPPFFFSGELIKLWYSKHDFSEIWCEIDFHREAGCNVAFRGRSQIKFQVFLACNT